MENERFELQNGANNKENGQNWTGNPKRIFKMEQIIPEQFRTLMQIMGI